MGYKKTQALMGSAILTRSQRRGTRSESKAEAIGRSGLSSPLEILDGNNLNPSSRRRRTPKPPLLVFSSIADKENGPPPLLSSFDKEANGLVKAQVSSQSLDKPAKKRRQPQRDKPENFKDPSCSIAESGSSGNPVNMDEHDPHLAAASVVDPSQHQRLTRASKRQATMPVKDKEILSSNEKINDHVKEKKKPADESSCLNTSLLLLLQRDYDKLYKKYQKLKEKKFDEVESLYEEQNTHMCKFVQATESLLEYHKGEIASLKRQLQEANVQELLERSRNLEEQYMNCRSHLLEEQSKNAELKKENERLQSLLLEQVAEKQKSLQTKPVLPQSTLDCSIFTGHAKLVQQLLENVLGLQLNFPDDGADAQLLFQHKPSGFSFILKAVHDKEMAEIFGGGQLMYQNVSLGMFRKAVNWMEEEVVFSMLQSQLVFKKLVRFFNCGLID